MKTQPNSEWPVDLRVSAWLVAAWSVCLMLRASVGDGPGPGFDPSQMIFFGMRYYGPEAQAIQYFESALYALAALGMVARRRWGVVLVIVVLAQVVASHFVYALDNFRNPFLWMSVKAATMQSPSLIIIALYFWIRSTDMDIIDVPRIPRRGVQNLAEESQPLGAVSHI